MKSPPPRGYHTLTVDRVSVHDGPSRRGYLKRNDKSEKENIYDLIKINSIFNKNLEKNI